MTSQPVAEVTSRSGPPGREALGGPRSLGARTRCQGTLPGERPCLAEVVAGVVERMGAKVLPGAHCC